MQKFQEMADKDPKGTHGAGACLFSDVTPAFDDFNPPASASE